MAKSYAEKTGIHPNTVNPKKRLPSWTGTKDQKRPVGFVPFTPRLPERAHVAAFKKALVELGYTSANAWFKSEVEKMTGLDLSGDEE